MSQEHLPKVFVNSFPKGGTNLVIRLLELCGYTTKLPYVSANLVLQRPTWLRQMLRGAKDASTGIAVGIDSPVFVKKSWLQNYIKSVKQGEVLAGHCLYSQDLHELLQASDIKLIQIVRDPRAIAVSHAHFVTKQKKHPMNAFYSKNLADFDERLSFSIRGGEITKDLHLSSIAERAAVISGWLEQKNVLSLRFEDLIGEQGGGDRQKQQSSILSVLKHLSLPTTQEQVKFVGDNLFGQSHTFREGQIESWRNSFKESHINSYNAIAADMTKAWGYEI